ncbi:MAG: O-antigen ligase family protein [Devosia sp.]
MTSEISTILGRSTDHWARMVVLVLTLALSCVVGLLTPYLLAVVGIVLYIAMAVRRTLLASYRDLAARFFLVAFAALAACFAITARQPGDLLFAFNFVMLLLFAPLRQLLANGAVPGSGVITARLALAGAALAVVVSLTALLFLNYARADTPLLGAIVLSNTAILLGFLSLIGVLADQGRLRWLYLVGPFLGIAVALVTASRGPLVAVPPLGIVAAVFLARHLQLKRRHVLLFLGLGIVAIGLLAVGLQDRFISIFRAAGDILSGAAVSDETTRIRLVLYEAGVRAYLESPWLGHGWARLMSAVVPYLPPADLRHAALPQLHNDMLNFAVAAGIPGIAVYLLLIATPIIAALRSPRDEMYELRYFGCIVLGVAYFFAGLTDLMFGFEFHTAIYISVAAILLGYCRPSRPA